MIDGPRDRGIKGMVVGSTERRNRTGCSFWTAAGGGTAIGVTVPICGCADSGDHESGAGNLGAVTGPDGFGSQPNGNC